MAFKDFTKSVDIDNLTSEGVNLKSSELINELLKDGLFEIKFSNNRKCDKKSQIYREKGNKHFKNNDKSTRDILLIYTTALYYAESEIERSYCLGNRSSVLFKMGLYEACNADIDRALISKYPSDKSDKLLLRKGEALIMLGAFEEARQCLNDYRLVADKFQSVQRRVKVALCKCDEKCVLDAYCANVDLMKHYPSANTNGLKNVKVAPFSDKVCLQINEVDGRGVFATDNINIGTVLAVETPYAYRLSSDCMMTHCYYCLQRGVNLMPCDDCVWVGFCNEQCQVLAKKLLRHDLECGIMSDILSTYSEELGLLAYGVIAKTDPNIVQACVESPSVYDDPDVVIDSQDYRCALSLATNEHLRSSKDLARRCLSGVFLAHCLVQMLFGKRDSCTRLSWVKTFSRAFVQHLQSIPCNAHSLGEHTTPLSGSVMHSSTEHIGNALYPALSMVNHSCAPNVLRVTMAKGQCVLRASACLARGDQIMDNYSLHFATVAKAERRHTLREQYHFECRCLACCADWPLFADQVALDQGPQLACPSCHSNLRAQDDTCPSCNFSLQDELGRFRAGRARLSDDMDSILRGQFEGVESSLLAFCSALGRLVKAPNILFHQTSEMLKLIWTREGSSVSSL